jgi:hypothetical protein
VIHPSGHGEMRRNPPHLLVVVQSDLDGVRTVLLSAFAQEVRAAAYLLHRLAQASHPLVYFAEERLILRRLGRRRRARDVTADAQTKLAG